MRLMEFWNWMGMAILCGALAVVRSAEAASLEFIVRETAGLRRFGYPVTASLEAPQGALKDLGAARLVKADGKECTAQFTAMGQWPDGSVRLLDVDFMSSIGPRETEAYQVELSGGSPRAQSKSGLEVTENADEVLVASRAITHKIRRDGKPLLTSVLNAKQEFIAPQGLTTTLAPGSLEVLKRGPFNVTLRMGQVTLEYVSSKSWVKIMQQADAPRELSVQGHFALGDVPLLWDVALEGWLYGVLRKQDESAILRRTADGWQVQTGSGDALTPFAIGQRAEGWGHFADRERVVAFGVADFRAEDEPRIVLGGDGRFEATARRKDLTVYFHFVGQPVNITALTSPPSMLAPLAVEQKR